MKVFSHFRRSWRYGSILPLLIACGEGVESNGPRNMGGHGHFARIELHTIAPSTKLLAAWSEDRSWETPEGQAITALPPPMGPNGTRVNHLQAGGPPLVLETRYFDDSDAPFDMAPVSADTAQMGPECPEFSARYYPLNDTTPVVAWPNVPHPQEADGASLFAKRASNEVVPVFGCNRVEIYPEEAGQVELAFVLWHVNHADQETDMLRIVVVP